MSLERLRLWTLAALFAGLGAASQAAAQEPDPAEACRAARAFLDKQLDRDAPRKIETCETATVAGSGVRWVAIFGVETVGRTVPPRPVSLTFKVVMTHLAGADPPWRLEVVAGE